MARFEQFGIASLLILRSMADGPLSVVNHLINGHLLQKRKLSPAPLLEGVGFLSELGLAGPGDFEFDDFAE